MSSLKKIRFSYTQILIVFLLQLWFVNTYFRKPESPGPEPTHPPKKDVIEPTRYFNMDEEFQKSIQSPKAPSSTIDSTQQMSDAEHKLYQHFHQKREYPVKLEPVNLKNKNLHSTSNSNIHLLLIIKSSCTQEHKSRRESIRKTWGDSDYIATETNVKADRLFLLGNCELNHDHKKLVSEHRRFNDILQWDMVDSFWNLTVKEVGQLAYVYRKRPEVTHVFKGDDDIFVNILGIVDLIKSVDISDRENIITGSVLSGKPVRNPKSKYFVPQWLFSDKSFPKYVQGGGFIYSKKISDEMLWKSFEVNMFNIDDAFVGVLLEKTGRKPLLDKRFVLRNGWKNEIAEQFALEERGCYWFEILVYHKVNAKQLFDVWEIYKKLREDWTVSMERRETGYLEPTCVMLNNKFE